MTRSKTIQIFLKDSDPQGIKIAELTNSIAKVYVIPRDKIEFAQTREDLQLPALYFLFDDERTSVYIGECENFSHRIKNHEVNKDFWQTAVVVTSNTSGLDKGEVKFLESHSVMKALEAGRFEVQNRTNPNKNNLHEFRLAAILDFFEDAILLLSTLGYNIFEPLENTIKPNPLVQETESIKNDVREFDTIVSPATGDGVETAFKAKNAWWAVRIGQNNIPKLKYVSIYEAAPISAIRYYAKITKIEPFEELPGKYIIHHDGNIIELENHVKIGNTPQLSPYGSRYYKLSDILSSKNLAELTDKTYGSNYSAK